MSDTNGASTASDTAERGLGHPPARRAAEIGAGLRPDDRTEGDVAAGTDPAPSAERR